MFMIIYLKMFLVTEYLHYDEFIVKFEVFLTIDLVCIQAFCHKKSDH